MTSQNASVPSMDKHRRLFEMLPEGARPRILPADDEWVKGATGDSDPPGKWRCSGYVRWHVFEDDAADLIEHAARLHYEGEGYWFIRKFGGRYEAAHSSGWGTGFLAMPLIDALLAAAEHAREGEGEK